MSKVSILVPIYNVEKYLRQCLDSLVNQTLNDIEIICINDGSTDKSLSIINEFANKDNRIKVINKKNTGYGHSMNCGLRLAQGEYIGIVESDDFAELDMFETLYNTAKNVGAEMVRSNYFWHINGEDLFNEHLQQRPYEKIFSPRNDLPQIFYYFPVIWSGIYNREFLEKNDIRFNETPGASYQDIAFSFKCLACAEKVFLLKKAFLHYRKDNPTASVKSKHKAYCVFDEFDEIKNFLSNHEIFNDPCRYVFPVMRYREFESSLQRMDNVFRFDFFKRMAEEFEQDKKDGYIKKDYWKEDTERWEELQELFNDKEKFFYKQYEKNQNQQMCIENMFSMIKEFKNIYIYGAGRVAALVVPALIRRKIEVSNILVSDIKNNPKTFMNISVNTLEGININKENSLILLAIREESQYKVLYQLQENDYKNIMVIPRSLYNILGLRG